MNGSVSEGKLLSEQFGVAGPPAARPLAVIEAELAEKALLLLAIGPEHLHQLHGLCLGVPTALQPGAPLAVGELGLDLLQTPPDLDVGSMKSAWKSGRTGAFATATGRRRWRRLKRRG